MRKLKRVVIKEELVDLVGSVDAAIVLNQMIYWSERVKDFDKFIEEENSRAEKEGLEQTELVNGWIYKSADELESELMGFKSAKTIAKILDNIVQKGWLSRRRNPKYKWDKTYQYRVNYLNIQQDLVSVGYTLEGYEALNNPFLKLRNREDNLRNREDKVRDRSGDFVPAIPEITSNIIRETTTTDVIGIFEQYGIDILPVIDKYPNLFSAYCSSEIKHIATELNRLYITGKVKSPEALLMKKPQKVLDAIKNGTFYPNIHQKSPDQDCEIFRRPDHIQGYITFLSANGKPSTVKTPNT